MKRRRELLNERDAADAVGVPCRTIQGWRFRGLGPPWMKMGGLVRYDAAELDRWVKSCVHGGERAGIISRGPTDVDAQIVTRAG